MLAAGRIVSSSGASATIPSIRQAARQENRSAPGVKRLRIFYRRYALKQVLSTGNFVKPRLVKYFKGKKNRLKKSLFEVC